ncbi:cytochrome c-type biogenesis protein CcmH [Aureimonas flava]|uniref:Cytochrome c-type biogenesis protein n=1 Tax=Aureimonas flava TaxID=2320271 RepID=A0A3A1WMT2_9HYPH|nr:cytochrome c-type biogenesis protein [Aureimonas flava]RIY01307.1 cytochrome c-type biogenesis protein CcmH [Aureimonas flava]
MALSRILGAALVAGVLSWGGTAAAVQPDEVLPNAAMEQRARDLSAGLRCMVCQNQSIDDSDAPLARDLRLLVRERITAGDSDEDVIDYLVSRYGDFVLLRPRLRWDTVLLWGTPVLLLLIGIAMLRRSGRRSAERPTAAGLSAAEEAALARLVGHGARDDEGR